MDDVTIRAVSLSNKYLSKLYQSNEPWRLRLYDMGIKHLPVSYTKPDNKFYDYMYVYWYIAQNNT